MLERTTRSSVQFQHPFRLEGIAHLLLPGVYEIETVEEPLDSLTSVAYRRVSTTIALPGPTALSRQLAGIDPADLAAALARDEETKE